LPYVLRDETENPVGMVKVLEDRLLVCAVLMPDDWKPIAGHDQFRAGQQPGDEAVKFFEQHRVLAEGEQFLVKLLEAARQSGHGRFDDTATGSWNRSVRRLPPTVECTDEVQVPFVTIGLVVSIAGREEDASSIFIFSNSRSVTILRSRRFSIVNSSRTRRISGMVDGVAVDGSAARLGAGLTSPLRSESFRQRWNVITLTPRALQIST
jgi:hypothetical protein